MARKSLPILNPLVAGVCLEITFPGADDVFNPGQEIIVRGNLLDQANFSHAFVGIFPDGGPSTGPYVLADIPDGTQPQKFSTSFLAPATTGNYVIMAKAAQNSAGGGSGWCPDDVNVELPSVLIRVRERTIAEVRAKQSLWCYKGSGAVGTWGDVAEHHRPTEVVVPAGAAGGTVDINVIPSGAEWWHGTNPATQSSNLDGYRTQAVLQPYIDFASGNGVDISVSGTPSLNQLVGMFDEGTNAFTHLNIGRSNSFPVPAGATRLLLAHHDSFEWNNNSDHIVSVKLVWNPPTWTRAKKKSPAPATARARKKSAAPRRKPKRGKGKRG